MKSKALTFLLLASSLFVSGGCQRVSKDAKGGPHTREGRAEQKSTTQPNENYGQPTKVGVLENRSIDESSGIVASRTTPGMYWTHNDSGDGPFIYAFDDRGRNRGVWRVTGALADDWEDMASGPGPNAGASYLYIGDIGDNSGNRSPIIVYRVPEPTIAAAAGGNKKNAQPTEAAEVLRFRYPDGRHNAETMMVHPVTGKIYIITKIEFGNPRVYEGDLTTGSAGIITLTRVGELRVPSVFGGMITGGSISPDGKRVALCDYLQGYELVLPDASSAFNVIWKEPLKPIALGQREQGEAIGYRLDGRALMATSEGRSAALIQVERR